MTSAVFTYAERFKTAMGVGAGVSGEFQGMQGLIMAVREGFLIHCKASCKGIDSDESII